MRVNVSGVKSRSARVGKIVHPCIKSFWKAVSTVMDDLEIVCVIIDNFNERKSANLRTSPPGGTRRWFEMCGSTDDVRWMIHDQYNLSNALSSPLKILCRRWHVESFKRKTSFMQNNSSEILAILALGLYSSSTSCGVHPYSALLRCCFSAEESVQTEGGFYTEIDFDE